MIESTVGRRTTPKYATRVLGEDVPVAKNRSYAGRYERPDAGLPER